MNDQPVLPRRLGLFQATVINMIDMVGIGPFIVLPLVIDIMGGPFFIYAWIAGAFLSFIDAMIWSELGASYPKAGGSYNFLKEAYGPGKAGRMLSFLYVWQTCIQAPLVVASGAIGFAQYFGYLVELSSVEKKIISGLLVIFLTFLLYRKIDSIGRIGTFLWIGVIATLLWIILGGITHGNFAGPIIEMTQSPVTGSLFFMALGQASVKTIYSYLGYYNVCHLGGEIINPEKNIPRSMFLSIAGISILYLAMNISVTSVIPWQEARHSEFIISSFIERLYGKTAAMIATGMVLWVAMASLFAVILGYSRVPYAAARDGLFFKSFARLHPTKNFPHISLLALGSTAFIFSLLFRLSEVITAILAMRIIIQFVAQAVGVIMLRKRNGSLSLPYKMPLYPLPVILVVVMWSFVFISTGLQFMLSGLVVIAVGLLVFLIRSFKSNEWPFYR
ncbi:MAG: amino acid permease [Bacteroidota bacterium]